MHLSLQGFVFHDESYKQVLQSFQTRACCLACGISQSHRWALSPLRSWTPPRPFALLEMHLALFCSQLSARIATFRHTYQWRAKIFTVVPTSAGYFFSGSVSAEDVVRLEIWPAVLNLAPADWGFRTATASQILLVGVTRRHFGGILWRFRELWDEGHGVALPRQQSLDELQMSLSPGFKYWKFVCLSPGLKLSGDLFLFLFNVFFYHS